MSEKNIGRSLKMLANLKRTKQKIYDMASCHVVSYKLKDSKEDEISFTIDKYDPLGFAHGMDQAGDLSGAFQLIKKAMIVEINDLIHGAEESLRYYTTGK